MLKLNEGDIVYRFFDLGNVNNIPGIEVEELWRVDSYEYNLNNAMHGENVIVLWTAEEVKNRIEEKRKTEKGEVFRMI